MQDRQPVRRQRTTVKESVAQCRVAGNADVKFRRDGRGLVVVRIGDSWAAVLADELMKAVKKVCGR